MLMVISWICFSHHSLSVAHHLNRLYLLALISLALIKSLLLIFSGVFSILDCSICCARLTICTSFAIISSIAWLFAQFCSNSLMWLCTVQFHSHSSLAISLSVARGFCITFEITLALFL